VFARERVPKLAGISCRTAATAGFLSECELFPETWFARIASSRAGASLGLMKRRSSVTGTMCGFSTKKILSSKGRADMADNPKIWPMNVSRRAVLEGVTSVVAATPIMLATTHPVLARKLSKASVNYRNSPNGNQTCANCRLFIPPSSCVSVEGRVSARGWCTIWAGR